MSVSYRTGWFVFLGGNAGAMENWKARLTAEQSAECVPKDLLSDLFHDPYLLFIGDGSPKWSC